jgi:hypothetical protein
MTHFVVHERPTTCLLTIRQFEQGDWSSADRLRNDLELQYRLRPEVEIALLWSDSLETLKATPSRYFGNVVDPQAPASLRVA